MTEHETVYPSVKQRDRLAELLPNLVGLLEVERNGHEVPALLESRVFDVEGRLDLGRVLH